jgi:hypothetical protein
MHDLQPVPDSIGRPDGRGRHKPQRESDGSDCAKPDNGGIAELLNDQPGMHASRLPELADVLPQERSTFAGPP